MMYIINNYNRTFLGGKIKHKKHILNNIHPKHLAVDQAVLIYINENHIALFLVVSRPKRPFATGIYV